MLQKSAMPHLRGGQVRRAAYEKKSFVTEAYQVIQCFADTLRVVHFDVTEMFANWPGIEKGNGYAVLTQLIDQSRLSLRGHYRDSIDLALQHTPYTKFHSFATVVA